MGSALDLVSFSTKDSSRRLQGAGSAHCRASPSWSTWTRKEVRDEDGNYTEIPYTAQVESQILGQRILGIF